MALDQEAWDRILGGLSSPSAPPPAQRGATVYWGSQKQYGSSDGDVVWRGPDGREHRGANKSPDAGSDLWEPLKRPAQDTPVTGEKDQTLSEDQAKQEFYKWDAEKRREWGEHLVDLGLIAPDDVDDYYTLEDAWIQFTGDAANLYAGGHKVTPWQAAKIVAGSDEQIAKRRSSFVDEAPFTGSKTRTSTNVDLTDPDTARAMVNDVMAQALGRSANDEELRAFVATLQSAERANPLTTTTTAQFVDGEQVGSSSVSSGGMTQRGRSELMLDEARGLPDYGAYQAATTYLQALFGAADAPV